MFKLFMILCFLALAYIYNVEYNANKYLEQKITYGKVIDIKYKSGFGHATDRYIVMDIDGDTIEILKYKINKGDSVKVIEFYNSKTGEPYMIKNKYEVIKKGI
jgi:hypothetical protein